MPIPPRPGGSTIRHRACGSLGHYRLPSECRRLGFGSRGGRFRRSESPKQTTLLLLSFFLLSAMVCMSCLWVGALLLGPSDWQDESGRGFDRDTVVVVLLRRLLVLGKLIDLLKVALGREFGDVWGVHGWR
jgi:hypothetical protein